MDVDVLPKLDQLRAASITRHCVFLQAEYEADMKLIQLIILYTKSLSFKVSRGYIITTLLSGLKQTLNEMIIELHTFCNIMRLSNYFAGDYL